MNSSPEIEAKKAGTAPRSPLDVATIYLEPNVENYPRGREILTRFPDAERIEVPSHWNIPGLHGNEGNVENWIGIKRSTLVLGVKKTLNFLPYTRSCDWVAPSHANGCALACSYCYVPRRKGFANPISTFVNIEAIADSIVKHTRKQGMKMTPTTADDDDWIYELGCNSDGGVDALFSDNLRDLIGLMRGLPGVKSTFATKWVNRDLLVYDPQRRTHLRFSLMPPRISKLVDIRTSPIAERIAVLNDFYEAGYEVNLNFAPVILYDGWQADWNELLGELGAVLKPQVKAQLGCEIIFLTHNAALHEVNLQWHPRGEEVLWRPDLQEGKTSQSGGDNVRYRVEFKQQLVRQFRDMVAHHLPECRIRYAF